MSVLILNYCTEFLFLNGFFSSLLLLNYIKLKKVNIKLNVLFADLVNIILVIGLLFLVFGCDFNVSLINMSYYYNTAIAFIVILFTIGIFFFCRNYFYEEKIIVTDILLLLLFNIIIILFMLNSDNFLVFFLLLEVQNILFFIFYNYFINWWYTHEASFRYYLISAFATTIILAVLIGFWGIYGTWNFFMYATLLETINNGVVQIFLTLFLFAFFIKLGVFPFQLWIVEVYQGLAYPIVFYLMIVPKLVFFFFLVKFYFFIYIYAFTIFKFYFFVFLISSMVWAMLKAMLQFSLIKFLVYSSMFNISFFLVSLFFNSFESLLMSFFFLFTYLLNFFFFFSVVVLLKDCRSLKSFYTLEEFVSIKNFFIAFALFVFIVSIAGIPPFLGFFGKFFVLWEVIMKGSYTFFFILLLLSLLAIYYYIRFTRFFVFPGYESFQFLKSIEYKYSYIISVFLFMQVFTFFFIIDYLLLFISMLI